MKVEPTLQLPGHPGVFAAGDIVDWDERKSGSKAGAHARVVVANIMNFVEDKPVKKVYGGSPEYIVIPIGKVNLQPYKNVVNLIC